MAGSIITKLSHKHAKQRVIDGDHSVMIIIYTREDSEMNGEKKLSISIKIYQV